MHELPNSCASRTPVRFPKALFVYSLATQRLGFLRAFAISALGSITYYVGITDVPSFLTSVGTLSEHDLLWISTGAAVVVILAMPLTGLLTDRWGRKPVLLLLCAASALLPVTLFSLMSGGNRLEALAGAILLAALAGAYSSVGAVATAEQFRGEGRLTGLALGATGSDGDLRRPHALGIAVTRCAHGCGLCAGCDDRFGCTAGPSSPRDPQGNRAGLARDAASSH